MPHDRFGDLLVDNPDWQVRIVGRLAFQKDRPALKLRASIWGGRSRGRGDYELAARNGALLPFGPDWTRFVREAPEVHSAILCSLQHQVTEKKGRASGQGGGRAMNDGDE